MDLDNYSILVSLIVAFAAALIAGPIFIPILRKLKIGQTERKEGVQSHLQKAGTPTMGGIIFLIGSAICAFVFLRDYPNILPVIVLMLGFCAVGFLDDYLKVVLKRSDGLLPWQKLILQFAVTSLFAFCILNFTDISLILIVPFTNETIDIGIVSIPFLYIVVLATVNAVNFTDGLDGLASSVTIVVAVFFMVASLLLDAGVEPVASAVAGSLMGFLCYNVFPAKIFMGDTGSLALGGFVAGMAYVMNLPLFIPIVGIVYVAELVSVVLQVSYFKLTHGKRIFKMTPIHHHFELCGWSEPKIVAVFTIITILACVIGLYALC